MVSSSGTPQKSLVQQKISFGSQGNLKLTPPSGLSTPPATPKRRRGKGDSPEIPEPPSKRIAVSSSRKDPCKPGTTSTEKTRARNVEQTIRNPKRGAQNSSQIIYVPSTPTSPTTPLELPSTSVSSNDTTTNGTTRGQVRGFLRYNSNILPHAIHLLYIRHTHSLYVSRSTTGSSMTTPFCPSLIPRSPPRLRFRPRKAPQLKIRSFTFQRVQNPKVITMGREMIKGREGRKRRSHRFLPYILYWIP